MRRFWTMAAHNHGQVWNSSRLAGSLGVAHTTVRSWLDVLRDTFMTRQLLPFIANTGKRQVKSPKVYIRDSGLLHTLLGIVDADQLAEHPIMGASWEGFAMEQIIGSSRVDERHCYFWGVHTGAELDLVVEQGSELLGFEFKRTLSPRLTPSMRSAIETLGLSHLNVVYPGTVEFPLSGKATAKPLSAFIRS